MLTDQYTRHALKESLVPAKAFHPFPAWNERDSWLSLPIKTQNKWLTAASKFIDFEWPAITADQYLYFNRTGSNMPYLMKAYERRSVLGILIIAECMEGKGRFLDQIINGIICICEETSWISPFDSSLRGVVLPFPEDKTVDLNCSETGALLVWAYYLLKENLDAVTPRICERIEKEIYDRLIVPYMAHDDEWWMGFVETNRVNNWNPWCNRNMLMCFLILDLDQDIRLSGIWKAMQSLDQYLLKYPSDGCCDEGPMYWGAAGGGLHTCLHLLKLGSGGTIDLYKEPIVQMIGQYIYKVHIDNSYFVNFADGDAIVRINPVIYRYGLDIADENLIGLGAAAEPRSPEVYAWFEMYDYLLDLFDEKERAACQAKIPYVRNAWFEKTQVMTCREQQGRSSGFFLAAKGGDNAESHNHNDIGNFIVYADGKPLLIDLGTEEYTAKTFSKDRFDLWYLQSAYHNCPTIRGVMQKDGKAYQAKQVACHLGDLETEITMDIAKAYPEEAGVASWVRTVRLVRDQDARVEVVDRYQLTEPACDISYSLMTPCEPVILEPGKIKLLYEKGKTAILSYDRDLSVFVEKINIEESRLKRNWGDVLYRILLKEQNPVLNARREITIRH